MQILAEVPSQPIDPHPPEEQPTQFPPEHDVPTPPDAPVQEPEPARLPDPQPDDSEPPA